MTYDEVGLSMDDSITVIYNIHIYIILYSRTHISGTGKLSYDE